MMWTAFILIFRHCYLTLKVIIQTMNQRAIISQEKMFGSCIFLAASVT